MSKKKLKIRLEKAEKQIREMSDRLDELYIVAYAVDDSEMPRFSDKSLN